MTQVTLPFPPKELSPNARLHWAKKAAAVKAYKNDCVWTMKARGAGYMTGASKFKIVFCPPSKRRMDADNMVARFKAGFDALSQITGVDDSAFEWTYVRGEPVKNGAVIVEVLI